MQMAFYGVMPAALKARIAQEEITAWEAAPGRG